LIPRHEVATKWGIDRETQVGMKTRKTGMQIGVACIKNFRGGGGSDKTIKTTKETIKIQFLDVLKDLQAQRSKT